MLRTQCVDLGLKVAVACTPLTGRAIKQYAIPSTVSQAWYIGRAVHKARRSKTEMTKAIVSGSLTSSLASSFYIGYLLIIYTQFETSPGRLLYSGKIIDVRRDVSRGYTMGQCTIAPLSKDEQDPDQSSRDASKNTSDGRCLIVPFQNEFLYAAYADAADPTDSSRHEVICTVPDLISILGQDGEAIGSQELRYGLRVMVIGMAAHPLWTADPRGLRVGGPEGFGLDMEWKSLGPYQEPRNVIQDFDQATR